MTIVSQLEREFETEVSGQRTGAVDVTCDVANHVVDVPSIDAGENCTVSKADRGRSHKIAWLVS